MTQRLAANDEKTLCQGLILIPLVGAVNETPWISRTPAGSGFSPVSGPLSRIAEQDTLENVTKWSAQHLGNSSVHQSAQSLRTK
jgi:hypothetical protein